MSEKPFSEATWDDLLTLIEAGKVVPVVGRALSFVAQPDGSTLPLQTAVATRLAQVLGIGALPQGWGLNELYVEASRRNLYSADAFHYKLKKVLDETSPRLDSLRKLAGIGSFRLFLTTAIDGYLERALRDERPGIDVQTVTFAPDGYYDLPAHFDTGDGVAVYKLLGGRETCPNWVVTVENSLEFVLGLTNEKYRPRNLLDAVKECHLLAIGCQIPDWLGRFFLRSLRSGPLSAVRTTNYLIEDEADQDHAFGRYLEQFSQRAFVVPSGSVAFVDELAVRWRERNPTAPADLSRTDSAAATEPQVDSKVFLSYSHADRDNAQTLFEFLKAAKVDVWKDDRSDEEGDAIPKGSDWERIITRRIDDCACFVPLISANTAARSESFFWQEWNHALERRKRQDRSNRRFIFPVLAEQDVAIPEAFAAMQAAQLANRGDLDGLARSLREEQQRYRKQQRMGRP